MYQNHKKNIYHERMCEGQIMNLIISPHHTQKALNKPPRSPSPTQPPTHYNTTQHKTQTRQENNWVQILNSKQKGKVIKIKEKNNNRKQIESQFNEICILKTKVKRKFL